tara:strand:- start:877 stop:990 length:114 start_codon:yes stop_codon:yes gene_type:complete
MANESIKAYLKNLEPRKSKNETKYADTTPNTHVKKIT